MTCTLWSRGRLLGASPLDFARVMPRHRMGFLHPTTEGERLLPIAAGVSPALVALSRSMQRDDEARDGLPPAAREERLRGTTAFADFAAAESHCDALALELRGPDGRVVPTEWIDVRDTEFLLSLARETEEAHDRQEAIVGDNEADEALREAIEHDEAVLDEMLEDAEPDLGIGTDEPWPRYQLQVMLRDDADLP